MTHQEFLLRWPTWCEEHGVTWGEPMLCCEPCGVVARWFGPRVSLLVVDMAIIPTDINGGPLSAAAKFHSNERAGKWSPVIAIVPFDVDKVCRIVCEEIDLRRPW